MHSRRCSRAPVFPGRNRVIAISPPKAPNVVFTLANFHTGLANHLAAYCCSPRSERTRWIRPEWRDDFERSSLATVSRFPTFRGGIGEIRRIVEEWADGKGNFSLFYRSAVRNVENSVEFSGFHLRDVGERVQHDARETRRGDPFTRDHEFSHTTGGRPLFSVVSRSAYYLPPHYFPPSLNFHAHFGDASNLSTFSFPLRCAKYSP